MGTHCHGLFSPQLPRGFLVLGIRLSDAVFFEVLELTGELLHSVPQFSQVLQGRRHKTSGVLCRCRTLEGGIEFRP